MRRALLLKCWQLTFGLIILLFFLSGYDDFTNFEEFRVRIWPNTLVNVLFIAFKGTMNVISSDHPLIEWHIRFTTVPFKPFCLIKFEWDIHVFVFLILIFSFGFYITVKWDKWRNFFLEILFKTTLSSIVRTRRKWRTRNIRYHMNIKNILKFN